MRRCFRLALSLAFVLVGVEEGSAALLVTQADGSTEVVQETAAVIFDPLTQTQTTLIRWTVRGLDRPAALLVPVSSNASVHLGHDRILERLLKSLRPVGKVRREVEIGLSSWAGACLVPLVGDVPGDDIEDTPASLRAEGRALVRGPRDHAWFLEHNFTLAPGQAGWLEKLQRRGFKTASLLLTPPDAASSEQTVVSPVLAISHQASKASYEAFMPRASIAEKSDQEAPLSLAVLSETRMEIAEYAALTPFSALSMSAKDIGNLERVSRGLPWTFRRAGTLTGFRLEARGEVDVLTFQASADRTPIKPDRSARVRTVRIEIPLEILLAGVFAGGWFWLRARRGRGTRGGII